MVDVFGIIAVGSALVIGIIPIMSKKLRGGDFLVSYVEPKYGKEETKYKKTTPGEDATKHLKPTRGSVLKIITYNFPEQEYENATWKNKLKEWKKNGVEIRIIGGPSIDKKARHSVEALTKGGTIKVRLLKKPLTYHVNIASSPNQLWIERYHKDGDAIDCTFTSKPYEEIWNEANAYFDNLWDKGQTLEVN
ncbi:MAG: hypothetical protein WA977_01250 [Halobacteriota archaeon]